MPIDVTINIYTVSGRLIRKIERFALADRFVKIDWNRSDSDGDEIGNGIYFYKVIAKTIDGKYSSEAVGKMAIVR
jgi:flagellar hook assembly protein FlgD